LPKASNVDPPINKLSRIYFTHSLIRHAIKRLQHKTKGGPDGIPPSFFINCRDELSYQLSLFFTFSFDNSILSSIWLTSFITPIFRKGNSTDPNNYRPIAHIATMSKLLESMIKGQMVQCLVDKGLISKHQHVFIKSNSTATNLLDCLRDWSACLESRAQIEIIYIDFTKKHSIAL
jgi:hypothetical protein